MRFVPIASGSSGNAYLVESTDRRATLLIEAGIQFKTLQRALNYRLSEIDACLISHSHNDHSRAVKDLLRAGLDCYMLKATQEELGIRHHRIKTIEPMVQFQIGDFLILPFDLKHDVENVGFIIQDGTGTKMLYATDTAYIKYRFNGLNIIAVECNYSEDILRQNILDGIVPAELKKRLERSHFSLENYKDFIRANDMSSVDEIWLLHMSDNNSDAERFQREIQAMTGVPVYIA